MANPIVQARVSDELKEHAENLFASMGLDMSDAIRLFLQQSVNRGALPFEILAKTPNAATLRAMSEVESDDSDLPAFDSVDDLLADLDADA